MITQEQLKQLLHYDPDTGIFTWLVKRGRVKIGDVAGTKDNHGYISFTVLSKACYAHRWAFLYMEGYIPKEIDHKDRVKVNNKWDNLRACTSAQNSHNVGIQSDNTSGIRGVCWDRGVLKWRFYITVKRRKINLGSSKDFFEACCRRKSAENKYEHDICWVA